MHYAVDADYDLRRLVLECCRINQHSWEQVESVVTVNSVVSMLCSVCRNVVYTEDPCRSVLRLCLAATTPHWLLRRSSCQQQFTAGNMSTVLLDLADWSMIRDCLSVFVFITYSQLSCFVSFSCGSFIFHCYKLFYMWTGVWNSLPDELRNLHSFDSLKRCWKTVLFSCY